MESSTSNTENLDTAFARHKLGHAVQHLWNENRKLLFIGKAFRAPETKTTEKTVQGLKSVI